MSQGLLIYVPDISEVSILVNHLRVKQRNLLKLESSDSNPEKCWRNSTQAVEVLQESNSSVLSHVLNAFVGIFHRACWHGFLLAERSRERCQAIR